MRVNKQDIEKMDRTYRLNLINSISGVKPANLVGTRSADGKDNLAIFSSVVHLGSNPAQLGLVMRPQNQELKDTYANIINTGVYTINHVSESFAKKAHYTSAKLKREESEFDLMKIERQFIDGFKAPFVKQSEVKIGMSLLEKIDLPNNCIFIVGEVVLVDFPVESVNDLGQLDMSTYGGVGISGLNTYYALNKIATYPYVRVDEIPNFNE
ncbi:MAG: flavin reductase [Vicingaceae bacterium]